MGALYILRLLILCQIHMIHSYSWSFVFQLFFFFGNIIAYFLEVFNFYVVNSASLFPHIF